VSAVKKNFNFSDGGGIHMLRHHQHIKEAITLLMTSPFYFRMKLPARKKMIEEFCRLHFKTEIHDH